MPLTNKILFIDRDGTLIVEPPDTFQVDTLDQLQLLPIVIPSLLQLKNNGYRFVMVTNQDGLGTPANTSQNFEKVQEKMLHIFNSQGITFEEILICPHLPADNCACRKPKLGLVQKFLRDRTIDWQNSFVIGDRSTDVQFAENLGIKGWQLSLPEQGWPEITNQILTRERQSTYSRKTNETDIEVKVNLDSNGPSQIKTGLGFFDHMLEQLSYHGGFKLDLSVKGDLDVDEHHTMEDTAIALGSAIQDALGDRWGIGRYGFVLPMDEASAQVAIDLSSRPLLKYKANFPQKEVGGLPTEMFSHFFSSFSQGLGATIHLEVEGENTHHMVEACFKGLGRSLKQAILKSENQLPSTKGVL